MAFGSIAILVSHPVGGQLSAVGMIRACSEVQAEGKQLCALYKQRADAFRLFVGDAPVQGGHPGLGGRLHAGPPDSPGLLQGGS